MVIMGGKKMESTFIALTAALPRKSSLVVMWKEINLYYALGR